MVKVLCDEMKLRVTSCPNDGHPVSYIDVKGYVYCETHGKRFKGLRRIRKLRPYEIKKLERGERLVRY